MKKIMFNELYGLQQATLDRRKNMTRRIALKEPVSDMNIGFDTATHQCLICSGNRIVARSQYAVGEVVAIAQSYAKLYFYENLSPELRRVMSDMFKHRTAAWHNKMFVKAELMPHHIKITNIRVEALCAISDEDCLREGIYEVVPETITDNGVEVGELQGYSFQNAGRIYDTPYHAFKALIDKLNKRGTFESNPIVFVYEYELVD